jgi:hypothetical protein
MFDKRDGTGQSAGAEGALEASKPEVVIVFSGKVWEPGHLPKGFDMSKAVIVSFEGYKIRFFDFHRRAGGYYARIPSEGTGGF